MYTYYIGLGSNLGDTRENLLRAVALMNERVGQVTALSSFYETEPWGFDSPHLFCNSACCVKSGLTPFEMLQATQQIEHDLGRTRKSVEGHYEDRVIDIDLLYCLDDAGQVMQIDSPSLCLPHPLIEQRPFVKDPLREIWVEREHLKVTK